MTVDRTSSDINRSFCLDRVFEYIFGGRRWRIERRTLPRIALAPHAIERTQHSAWPQQRTGARTANQIRSPRVDPLHHHPTVRCSISFQIFG